MVGHHFHVFQVQAVHHVCQGCRLVVEPVDGGLDTAVRGNHHLHVVAGHELDVVDGEDVGRVAHGKDERGTGPVDRDRLVFLHYLHRDQLDHRRIDVEIGKVYGGDAVLLGKERRQFRLADESFFDEDGAEPELASGALLLFEGLLKLLFRYQVAPDQELAHSARLHGNLRCQFWQFDIRLAILF